MHPHKTERGQAMAEMALVTPVLVLLFFGMTLDADWSATLGAEYQVEVAPPGGPGQPGGSGGSEIVGWRAWRRKGGVVVERVRSKIGVERTPRQPTCNDRFFQFIH